MTHPIDTVSIPDTASEAPQDEIIGAVQRLQIAAYIIENLAYDLARTALSNRVARLILLASEVEHLEADLINCIKTHPPTETSSHTVYAA